MGGAWLGTDCFCLFLFSFGLQKPQVQKGTQTSRPAPTVASLLTQTVNPCSPFSLHSHTPTCFLQNWDVLDCCFFPRSLWPRPLCLTCQPQDAVHWLCGKLSCWMEKHRTQPGVGPSTPQLWCLVLVACTEISQTSLCPESPWLPLQLFVTRIPREGSIHGGEGHITDPPSTLAIIIFYLYRYSSSLVMVFSG